MTSKNIEIENISRATRNAILICKSSTRQFKDFPSGCCRDASVILGIILGNNGIKNLKYCSRDIDSNFPSHSWLEFNEFVIDITADQFGSKFPSVIVSNETSTQKLHKKQREIIFNSAKIAGIDIFNILHDFEIIIKSTDSQQPFQDIAEISVS